ncbi:AAA family ATPase [Glutamicibacter endophyticus]|uniref:AAA family ATPase n=1 Tax=Glutamicibacter endophyticus TaxID=1522174 RepID=UPI003AF034C8
MDENLTSFADSFVRLSRLVLNHQPESESPRLVPVLREFLGAEPSTVPVLTENFSAHRLADANIVLDDIVGRDPNAKLIGFAGRERHHMELADHLESSGPVGFIGEPDYISMAVGPDEQRRFLSMGMHLFTYRGTPMAVLIRTANERFGRSNNSLEIVSPDQVSVDSFINEFRVGLRTTSIYRGHVITFKPSEYGSTNAGVTFHHRGNMQPHQLVLPSGTRERIDEQVLGIGKHRDFLRDRGIHLKRGVLLYGPPGTGKTHTVRYLTSAAKDHTVVLLNGNSLALVSEAAAMARALQPSLVVLEDCDLIAEDRSFGHGPQPLLFEVLDAMDGLDPDADVTFLLTTNRVESLERALVQRPGRIDLAVEIPRPDRDGRLSLLHLYGKHVHASEETFHEVAERIDGTTASFIKELIRRSVLLAAAEGIDPSDSHLIHAAEELMSNQADTTRNLLGGTADPEHSDEDLEHGHVHEGGSFGFFPEAVASVDYFAPEPGIAPGTGHNAEDEQ